MMTDNHEQIQQMFTLQAASFGSKYLTAANPEYLRWMTDHLALQPTDRVIDVAAGTGHLSRAMAPFVQHVTAFDLTQAMLDQGQQHAADAGLTNLTFQQGQAEQLPFPAGTFDLAVTRFAVHHFPQPRLQLAEMVRVTKVGGRVAVIDLVAPADPLLASKYNYLEWRRDPSHTFALMPDQLSALLHDVGVTLITNISREIAVSVDAWLDLTKPTDDVRTEILTRIDAELNGDAEAITGMRPFLRDDGQRMFMQTWVIAAGTVGAANA
jgi:ubiquinone/menaquinone biosynthesis C-methylase UbiE